MAVSQVYVVLRTDYLDRDDSEGRLNLISVHATPISARQAMNQHIKDHNKYIGISDPNTNNLSLSGSLFGAQVIVGDPDYHSYDVRVVQEIVHQNEEAEDASEEETTVKKTNGSKAAAKTKAKPKAKTPAKRKAPSDNEEEDEEAMPPPPSGSSSALAGMKFLITGTLEGLKRDEGKDLIERHGGEYVKAMPKTDTQKKPDYIVLGVKPGQKKVDEIRSSGYSTINQEELYEMIETRSSGKAKKAKK